VQPLSPGFSNILIKPHLESCQFAEGCAPTPVGTVSVKWHKLDQRRLSIEATVPAGVPTVMELPGIKPLKYPNGGQIRYDGAFKLMDG
jgi:hypothetical protein